MGRIVDSVSEKNRREVDVGEVTSSEVVKPVSGETLDPFCTRAIVQLWVRGARALGGM